MKGPCWKVGFDLRKAQFVVIFISRFKVGIS